METTQSFHCPECGAPLDYNPRQYPPHTATIRCPYCQASVIVPEALRPAPGAASSAGVEALPNDPQNADFLEQLVELLGVGNKIGAIKLYRQSYNVGLAEAKQAVEALAAGKPFNLPPAPQAAPPVDLTQDLARITSLAQSGNKIEAIKLYRQTYPTVGLKQAKEAVEALQAGYPLDHLPSPAPAPTALDQDATIDEIIHLGRAGQKLEAIKLYRLKFDVGLQDAKEAVEALTAGEPPEFVLARHPVPAPQPQPAKNIEPEGFNYTGLVVALIILASLAVIFFFFFIR